MPLTTISFDIGGEDKKEFGPSATLRDDKVLGDWSWGYRWKTKLFY